jgi:hypothetical protein
MPAMSSRQKYADNATEGHFAIVPVYDNKLPENAIMHGSLSALIDGRARADQRAEQRHLRADAVDLMSQGQRLNELYEQQQARDQEIITALTNINDSLNSLSSRMDSLEEQQREQARFNEAPLEPPHGFTPADELVPQAPAKNPEPKDPLEFEGER